jgi:methylase of polypeptide subunit release factors
MKVNRRVASSQRGPLDRLGEGLRAAGYGPAALREQLGVARPDDVGLLNRASAYERLRTDRSPTGVAMRLFYLEGEERAPTVRPLLSAAEQADLVRARLLAVRGGAVRARLRIDVHDGLYLLADRRFRDPDAGALRLPAGDMVYPPGSDSALLAEAVPARDGERVLDLCTGSGIQALAVAARAAGVVAVDLGARAAALARVNMLFNGVTNVEVRQGDLFAPVRHERFDLLIANPPFVPAPARGPAYHSGGPRGDRVLRRVVAGLGAHLRDGGRAVIISHLALRRGETVAAAVTPWLRGFDGRVLALVLETGTPVDLAAAQALFALEDGFAAYADEVRRWVAYLARQRIEQIVLLLIAAERRGRGGIEVAEAFQRVLPLPLSQPPRTLVDGWLTRH